MRAQALDVGALGRVGALNLVAQIVHDLGDAAHADAADADEMDGADVQRNAGGDGDGGHHAAFLSASCSTTSASLRGGVRRGQGMGGGGAVRQIGGIGENL